MYVKTFEAILDQLYRFYEIQLLMLKGIQDVLNDPRMKITQVRDDHGPVMILQLANFVSAFLQSRPAWDKKLQSIMPLKLLATFVRSY